MKAPFKPKSIEASFQQSFERCAKCNHAFVAHLPKHRMCEGLIQTIDGVFVCKCTAFERPALQEVAR